jgi:hypothetical protein
MCVWARRSGKDLVCFNALILKALERVGVYYLIYPTYSQGRRILWDSMTIDGQRFLDYIPPDQIESTNSTEMKIRLVNGSLIQILGSTDYDRLVGTNPVGVIYSEYALQDPKAAQLLRPAIMAQKDSFEVYITTPRGHNAAWELWNIATHNPKIWFSQLLTVEDTGHIPILEIQREIERGEISWDLSRQEYFCDWSMGVQGSYYSRYIDKMRLNNQIGMVPWEPAFKVHLAIDIGVRDSTTIIWWQNIGGCVRILDCYENSKEGLEFYAKIIQGKPYQMGRYIAPHDIAVKEWGSGMTRIEKAKQLGIPFTVAGNYSIEDGIEAVRSTLPKCWIDEVKCKQLIKALENYRQEWDDKRKVYKTTPLHDQWSHFCDGMRYLCTSLPKTRDSRSSEDIDRAYAEAMSGSRAQLPRMFQDTESHF